MNFFKFKRKELLGILYLVVAYFLAILIVLNCFAFTYSTLISNFFHQSSFEIIDDGTSANLDTDYFKLDYTSISQLEVDEREYAERVQSEGVIPKLITGEIVPSGKTADTFVYDVESPIAMLNYENIAEDQGLMSGGERVGNYINYRAFM